MVQPKSEWDVTSMTPSSFSASPSKLPAYFVQSPRDSDDYACKSSCASAPTPPAYSSSSPTDSPSHPSNYYVMPSNPRSSSASRVSGNWLHRKRSPKEWHECSVIKEEGGNFDNIYQDEEDDEGRSTYFMAAVLGVALVFAACSLVIWCASRPYNTQIIMEIRPLSQSVRVDNFNLGEGSDRTGVPTKMMTVNCTATMFIHNPATFFGIYVTSYPVQLFYSEVTVATGELKKYFQPRKSSRIVSASLEGYQTPLYGAGANLLVSDHGERVTLKLDFIVKSWGFLVGGLVKTKHHKHISCTLAMASKVPNEFRIHQNSCTYK